MALKLKDVQLPRDLIIIPEVCGTCLTFSLAERRFDDTLGEGAGVCCREGWIERTYVERTPEEAHKLSKFEPARKIGEEMKKTGNTCWTPPNELSARRFRISDNGGEVGVVFII